MEILFYILLSTSLISLTAFAGALTFFLKEELIDKLLLILVAFSAGALIGGAFLHLLPEAIAEIGIEENALFSLFLFTLLGFCLFFVLEQFIRWHHHHNHYHDPQPLPVSYLILISDSIHNFIDGLAIAASFIVAAPIGVVTALSVALHEIPQEIGDFGILVYSGFKKLKALFLNFLSAITVVLGGIVGFLLAGKIGGAIVYLLPFAAGNFIYIAAADLIPEIKHATSFRKSVIHFSAFLLGIALMLLIKLLHHE